MRRPAWPDTLELQSTTISTAALAVKPTSIYYDWPISRMLTRLFDGSGGHEELILTDSTTYDVPYAADGTHACGDPEPVGLPRPNWPTCDGGQVIHARPLAVRRPGRLPA